jgi:hypothetical protein
VVGWRIGNEGSWWGKYVAFRASLDTLVFGAFVGQFRHTREHHYPRDKMDH